MSALLLSSQSYAENNGSYESTIELSQGYRRDRVDLKTSNKFLVRSSKIKDKFNSVDTYTSRLVYTLSKNEYFLEGMAGYGNVYDGKLHRSFYLRRYDPFHRNRTSLYTYSASRNLSGDYTADFSLTFGKNFHFANGWSVAPTIGYGVYLQNFHTNRANGQFRTPGYYRRILYRKGKEKYKASWYSPQIGLQFQKILTPSLNAYLEYYFLFPLSYYSSSRLKIKRYHLDYDENNTPYKSLGNICTLGFNWKFAKNWFLNPEFELMKFFAKGVNSEHYYNLKHARRTATEYRLVLGYNF